MQGRQLAIEEPDAVNDERALVLPAETPRAAAGEDGRTPACQFSASIHSIYQKNEGRGNRARARRRAASGHRRSLPDRLEFYENWLNPQGLRDGTIGLAPLQRRAQLPAHEGDAYEAVTRRAGEYAARLDGRRAARVATAGLLALLPRFAAPRARLRVARNLVHAAYTGSRAT